MRRISVLILLVLLMGIGAQAQTLPITGTEIQVFRAADAVTGTPFRTLAIPGASITCNLAPTAVPTVPPVNPRFIEYDDSAITGRACRANVAAFLSGLPAAANYKATLTFSYTGGVTARSNATGPFDVALGPPAAPMGVGVRP